MAEIPKPPGSDEGEVDRNPNANCPKYEPIMGGYCKYYLTRTGECTLKFGKCDGFGVLEKW